ncbi:MAG: TraR/DksA family transcriptional regulator [Planctomycetota bacterium]|jgi:RNA polymerase-binding protein DksA
MHESQIARHKSYLLALRARLTHDLDGLYHAIAEKGHAEGDISRLPFHTADHDTDGLVVAVAMGRNQAEILAAVEDALKRIEDASYGQCEECGRKIAEARLEAIPYAARCIDCERARE